MRMISHDALIVARRIFGGVQTADVLARNGHDAQSRALLSQLASEAAAELPVIDEVLRAQAEAAKALDFAQGGLVRPLVVSRKPTEYPHASNDH